MHFFHYFRPIKSEFFNSSYIIASQWNIFEFIKLKYTWNSTKHCRFYVKVEVGQAKNSSLNLRKGISLRPKNSRSRLRILGEKREWKKLENSRPEMLYPVHEDSLRFARFTLQKRWWQFWFDCKSKGGIGSFLVRPVEWLAWILQVSG